VGLYNESFTGGYTAQYEDGTTASPEVLAGEVRIDGRRLRAAEARFGGIVVQLPVDEAPDAVVVP
jgi:hypothetical protein